MAVAHVQFASQVNTSTSTSVTVTLGSAPTAGNVLVFLVADNYYNPDDNINTPAGFKKLDKMYNSAVGYLNPTSGALTTGFQVFYRVVASGDGTSYTATAGTNAYLSGAIVEVSGAGIPVVRSAPLKAATSILFAGQDATVESTSYAFMAAYARGASSMSVTTPTGFTELLDAADSNQSLWCGYDIGATTISDLAVANGGTYLTGMLVEIPESGTEVTPWDGANFVDVAPSGGSYTSLATALGDADIRNGVYRAQWASNTAYTSTTYIQAPNVGFYYASDFKRHLHVSGAPGFRHSGVAGTGHARVDVTGKGFVFYNYSNFGRVSHLEIQATDTSIEMANYPGLMVDNIIFNNDTSSSRGVDVKQNVSNDLPRNSTIYNCVFHSFGGTKEAFRAPTNGSPGYPSILHCSIDGRFSNNAEWLSANLYNNWWRPGSYNVIDSGGRTNLGWVYGEANVYDGALDFLHTTYDDYTFDTRQLSSAWTTTTTSTGAIIVTNTTSGSENLTPLAPTGGGVNPILGAGSTRVPSLDPRVDLSLDIAGNPRPTTNVDIGAFQISEGGAAAATGTGIQVYTGSEWVNANAIQYYDGEWT